MTSVKETDIHRKLMVTQTSPPKTEHSSYKIQTDIKRKEHYQLSKRKQTFLAEDKKEEFEEKSKERRVAIRGRMQNEHRKR
jgi:hypothetical protein